MNVLTTIMSQRAHAKELLKNMPITNGTYELFNQCDIMCAIFNGDDNIYPLLHQKRRVIKINHQQWIPYFCVVNGNMVYFFAVSPDQTQWDHERWINEHTPMRLIRYNEKHRTFEVITACVDLNNAIIKEI